MRGDSANAIPARIWVQPVPIDKPPAKRRHSEEGDAQHDAPPEALHHPRGHAECVATGEERPDREQVAVRLVLDLATEADRVPQLQRPDQEVARCLAEIQLGVRDDLGQAPERTQRRTAAGTHSHAGVARPAPDRPPRPDPGQRSTELGAAAMVIDASAR